MTLKCKVIGASTGGSGVTTLQFNLPFTKAQVEAVGIDWQALLAAIEQYGLPLVLGVVQDILTKNYADLINLALLYGAPLILAILAALGVNPPAPVLAL